MIDVQQLGWDPDAIGMVDHRDVKPPYIRLSSHRKGQNGDVVYTYDLRVTQPNQSYLDTDLLHSFEHFLLDGLLKYYDDIFCCVAPMGCQTGFYLVLLNEGHADAVCALYEKILTEITQAEKVPYASTNHCGQAHYHNLHAAQELAKQLLACKNTWREVL